MKSLWGHLGELFSQQRKSDGLANAATMFTGAVRATLFQKQHRELLELEIYEKYIANVKGADTLFHLSHRYYLSNSFNQRQRIDAALTHYRYEGEYYDSRYKDAVYRDGGIVLWSRAVDQVVYAIKLRATTELRHEGGISAVLCVDDVVICEMSYAWVGGCVLGLDPATILFITRNQSVHRDAESLMKFRRAFPQNSPAYFCLAAVHGIAQANGSCKIAAIRHERQVAFEERYAAGFRNSYCEFWKTFAGVERGPVAHVMPVPLAAPPLMGVKAKHRKRALDRRRFWTEISHGALQALAPHVCPQGVTGAWTLRVGTSAAVTPVQLTTALLMSTLGL